MDYCRPTQNRGEAMSNNKNGNSKIVKVSEETHAILKQASINTGKSIKTIVDDIVLALTKGDK